MIRALLGKTQRLSRPGHEQDAQAASFPGAANVGYGVMGGQGKYVTWSGTSATVHTRLLFGISGHGIGSEFI